MYGNQVQWCAGPPGTNLHGWATQAIDAWRAIPELSGKFLETCEDTVLDFSMGYGICDYLGQGTVGCTEFDWVTSPLPDFNAQFIAHANIKVNTFPN